MYSSLRLTELGIVINPLVIGDLYVDPELHGPISDVVGYDTIMKITCSNWQDPEGFPLAYQYQIYNKETEELSTMRGFHSNNSFLFLTSPGNFTLVSNIRDECTYTNDLLIRFE